MTRRQSYQRKITATEFTGSSTKNIDAAGDDFGPKEYGELRIAFQNIHGASDLRGWEIPSEIDVLEELDIDIMGMAETNKPWTGRQKMLYNAYMGKRLRAAKTIYTAAPHKEHNTTYQPGGNLLTINGDITARIDGHGTDTLGRFCWYTLAGKRDEGVIIIVAYRVCQERHNNPGPLTAFQQQYVALREAGHTDPNPRKQILTDIRKLIHDKRSRGYRPILLIDANGDYMKGKDKDLERFLDEAYLIDPFADKFGHTRTYLHGSSRIDYIFMDRALVQSVKKIGYLGTHEGAPSDHVMAYVDMDQASMFAGLINRPPPASCRGILIEQEDKVQRFLRETQARLSEHTVAERVYKLAETFAKDGPTPKNMTAYNKLYGQFIELVQGAANRVGRKKNGYTRSPQLTRAGSGFLLHRYANDCRQRGAPPTKKLIALGERLSIDIETLLTLPEIEFRREMRRSREDLWERQKNGETLRLEWLTNTAKDNARAAGDQDWETRLKTMHRKLEINAVNRKLTAVTKGPRGALRMIQVPTHDWFYSEATRELYHYNRGVFEAFPAATDSLFHLHHTRKVLPSKIQAVLVTRDLSQSYWTISTILPMPRPLWRDITKTEEIESELLQRNKMHLEQTAREGGISVGTTLTTLRQNHGFNKLSQQVLRGEQVTEYDLTPEMSAFFHALAQTDIDKQLRPVTGVISSTDFQEMFRRAKETTSSDSRTPNYMIWKCLAKHDEISGFASVLLSLPFIYGFPNAHWTHMTDFMLEKKQGVKQIHTLRIIGKVAAEFNTCLKLLIGKQARDNYEQSDTSDEQHGFRPHRSAPDAMMLKLLTFESARMQKCTVGSLQHDMTAHFDRMYPEMTSIYATKYAVSQNVMTSIGKTIALLQRNVETALGMSTKTYCQEQGEPRLGGMVQGKADVPQLSTQQSDIMLRAHKKISYGVLIESPGLHRRIRHNSIAFADDTEGQVASDTTEDLSIPRIVRRLQHSGQTWSNLTSICGGLIAHHKCFWQLLAWEERKGHLHPRQDIDEVLSLHNGKGSYQTVEYKPPHEPNVGLGFNICPDGNQTPHFNSTISKIRTLCKTAAGAYLTEAEARILLHQRLLPKLSYSLHGTSFSRKQCGQINTTIRGSVLPTMRFNRHYPSTVLYGPKQYGGMEFPETYTLQDQVQLDYLIKQLRWDKVVANNFLVTLDSVQMCSGFTSPILESTKDPIDYLMQSYIISIRQRLAEMKAHLWIEKSWCPKIQRVKDRSIMHTFVQCPQISRAMLRQANAVRLYLRVVIIADLADVGGTYIPAGILTGNWQAGSDLKWPYQPSPPKTFWGTFRRCLRLTFCTNTPLYSHPTHSLILDTPLGAWHAVPRNTWFLAYRSKSEVFWRHEDKLYQLTPSKTHGFYHKAKVITTPPIESHPIRFQQMDDTIWTHGPCIFASDTRQKQQMGTILEDTLIQDQMEMITLGSDGSVHLHEGLAACSWVIHQASQHLLKAYYILETMSSLSSYRSELEGMYRGLRQLELSNLAPELLQQWCDNEAAVTKSNTRLYTPGMMLSADADILLAIEHTRSRLTPNTKILCRHVYGHQDSDRGRPHHDEQQEDDDSSTSGEEQTMDVHTGDTKLKGRLDTLPLSAQVNIECDRIATESITIARTHPCLGQDQNMMRLPYEGSRALLNIDGTWITSKQRASICQARWGIPLQEYCCRRYGWDTNTFNMVYWRAIGTVRNNSTHTQQMQTSKIMHGWLPVMHMHGHTTGNTQCPGCDHPDETMDHLFQCRHKPLMIQKDSLINTVRTKGMKLGVPRAIMEAICRLLYEFIHTMEPTIPEHPSIAEAVQSQLRVGIRLLPRGFLSSKWGDLMTEFGVQHPERKLSGVLKLIWFDFTEKLWHNRNEILHKQDNMTRQRDGESLATTLRHFLLNPLTLAPRDQFMLTYTEDDINRMTSQKRKRLVEHLERLEKLYTDERKRREKGQRSIWDYIKRRDTG